MFHGSLYYDVARSIQADRQREAAQRRLLAGRSRHRLDGVAVRVGVGRDEAAPRLRRRLTEAKSSGSDQPVVQLVNVVNGQVDQDPERVAGLASHLLVDPDRQAS